MPSAVMLCSYGPTAPPLYDDLEAAGVQVVGETTCPNFLQDVIKIAPDLVVCFDENPEPALFERILALAGASPRPVALFTTDPDAEKIAMATRSGVHAYVVNGYSRNRLRSVIHLAQARFQQEQVIRTELAEVNRRFAERKLVDRAKGILMGARQLREEEAFRALRSAAMASKQRIGQISQVVIDSARYAEAMNRAGQLRMLSQRLVKLYALACTGVRPEVTRGLFEESLGQVEDNLATLARTLSRPTFGDLLDAVTAPWARLRAVLKGPCQTGRLGEVDGLAEQVLEQAEQLTFNLEVAAYATTLHVLNVAGRQRMLCQRLVKTALLAWLLKGDDAMAARTGMAETTAELVQGLAYLEALPLSNAEITKELHQAIAVWAAFQIALAEAATTPGREQLAELSEVLLGHFDRLTNELERSMQAMVGTIAP